MTFTFYKKKLVQFWNRQICSQFWNTEAQRPKGQLRVLQSLLYPPISLTLSWCTLLALTELLQQIYRFKLLSYKRNSCYVTEFILLFYWLTYEYIINPNL